MKLKINSIQNKSNMILHVVSFFLIFLASCSSDTTQSNTESAAPSNEQIVSLNQTQINSIGLTLTQLEKKDISSLIYVNGKIDVPPQNMVSVSMPLGGYLKSTKLLPGMHVSKGEVIATMEDLQFIQLQQEYLTTKSKLMYTETEYQRQKELNLSKATSDKVFQQSEMEYNSLKISISALSEKLKLINVDPSKLSESTLSKAVNIYSPIDGFVSKVNVNIGKYVNPSDILFELVNPTDIHLNLKIFEKDLEKLYIGQKLVAYTNNKPNEKHPCEIILISKDISIERTAEVHCHFEDYDKNLLPGMYMNAEIKVESKKSDVVPDAAVLSFEGKDYVFVNEGQNSFKMTEVTVGISNEGFTEIKFVKPLNETNLKIVNKGAYSLLMQLKNKSEE